ncbi:phosphatase PAP2 family protein [candidate division KSB1 bacterium]
MKRLLLLLITIFLCYENLPAQQDGQLLREIKKGIKDLYTDHNLLYMFLISGTIANTNIDCEFRDHYQENIRSQGSDDFSRISKPLGEGLYVFPVYPAVYYLGKLTENENVIKWAEFSMMAAVISAPGILTSQLILGGARPTNGTGSKWWGNEHKFNGASGHTWVAAVPFITAAKMTENRVLKCLLFILSASTGLSRVNDDAHYLSQVILGYTWAYLGVSNVLRNREVEGKYGMLFSGGRFGLYIRF